MAEQHRWGMVIDLDRCTGCQACVVACQAENNVALNEEQQFLRAPRQSVDPHRALLGGRVPGRQGALPARCSCQHCGNAPCEPVCPVYATYHTPDGLNVQVYNRCVGTRYCANNCPYNVRFFNFSEPTWPAAAELAAQPGRHACAARASWRSARSASSASTAPNANATAATAAPLARRRRPARVRPGVPDRRPDLRRLERPRQSHQPPRAGPAALSAARRARHRASGRVPEEGRSQRVMASEFHWGTSRHPSPLCFRHSRRRRGWRSRRGWPTAIGAFPRDGCADGLAWRRSRRRQSGIVLLQQLPTGTGGRASGSDWPGAPQIWHSLAYLILTLVAVALARVAYCLRAARAGTARNASGA